MRINFVGDVGIFRKFEEHEIDPFEGVYLPAADLNIANFEFIISKERKRFFYDVQDQYSCSYEYLERLSVDRFDGFGLANNHSLDYGLEGALDVIEFMNEKGVSAFGFSTTAEYSIGSLSQDGITVGIIAFVKEGRWSKNKHGFGPDSYDPDQICKLIRQNKNEFNHLIVYPHWGTELVEIPDVRDTENARRFIDAGATAVIGHHPHISQGIETFNGGVIAYSLGSFIYIPEQELGYSADHKNRDVSICLQLELGEERMLSYRAHYYRYNKQTMIPEPVEDDHAKEYAKYLNENVFNRDLYRQQVKKDLLRRELRSFLHRFRAKPFQTIWNYSKLMRVSKLKKMIR